MAGSHIHVRELILSLSTDAVSGLHSNIAYKMVLYYWTHGVFSFLFQRMIYGFDLISINTVRSQLTLPEFK